VRWRWLALAWCTAALAGCAVPRWVPFLGKDPKAAATRPAETAPSPRPPERERPATAVLPPDDSVVDRVVAVVNNDAITLAELYESVAAFKQENRQQRGSDEEIASQLLSRLIEGRLQLQEAEREKILVEDAEVNDELADRVKKLGVPSMEQFEAMIREQGVTMDAVRKRIRDGLRMAKLVNRKVRLRISVTEGEIDRYLEENRAKLETGLAYHARHILILPEAATVAAWDAAKERAEGVHAKLVAGADFVEMAREHSGDATARDGGDLGVLKRGELAQDIEARIVALAPGEISTPFRSALGFHIFRLESKEALEGEGLVRARQQIRDILFREKYEARFDAWLKEIKQRAIIEVRM
jgi:peptidyl-prolyl cis-trans isomerase SurA